jgi:prevent-host-death family protein
MTMVAKRQMAAGEFKAKCLQVMDQVAKRRQPVVVTKRGKPVVCIVPVEPDEPRSIFGALAGQLEIVGDIETPVLPAKLWEGRR